MALNEQQLQHSKTDAIVKTLNLIKEAVKQYEPPLIFKIIDEYGQNPFLILIGCLLSLRARDAVTYRVTKKLFSRALTPKELISIPISELESMIFEIGTYKRKAAIIQSVSKELIERFDSQVPNDKDLLLSIKGIGQKTANLVLAEAFNIPAICVDVHVHRIANCLGWVKTKTSQQTEKALEVLLPKELWREVNHYLVMLGQNVRDIHGFCSALSLTHSSV